MKSKEEINKIIKGARKNILYSKNMFKREAKKSGDWVSYVVCLNAFCLAKIKTTEAKILNKSLDKKFEASMIASNIISGVIKNEKYIISPHISAISKIDSYKKTY